MTLGDNNVGVFLSNGSALTIRLVNSPLKDLPAGEKATKAREIARLAVESYAPRSTLKSVSVTFAVHRSYLGIFNYDDATDFFRFAMAQLIEKPSDSSVAPTRAKGS